MSRHLLASLRPNQWVKNLFIFAALVFSKHLFVLADVLTVAAAFAVFCLLSGSVYLINDVCDRQEDRLHPLKSKRPIASGRLKASTALLFALLLAGLSLPASFILNLRFGLVALAYFALNLLYSIALKHFVIIDVLSVGSGFVLRAIAGAVVINVEFSHWLVLCTFLLALFISFSKRRHELTMLGEQARGHRRILTEYSPYFLDMMIAVVTASTVISYALYTVSEETIRKFNTRNLVYTTAFVIYGIFRYLYLIHRRSEGGNPSQLVLADRPLQAAILLWILTVFVIVYII